MRKRPRCDGAHSDRRDFLRVGSLSFLGISLSQFLQVQEAMAAAGTLNEKAKAQSCILLWMDGGPSQMDTWDPKPNSRLKAISTNVPGIQISEIFPRVAKHMDKLAVIRSMHHEVNGHGGGHQYVLTGHKGNPAMEFPGLGAIITKELGARNNVPPHVMAHELGRGGKEGYEDLMKGHFIGSEYDAMLIPNPNPVEPGEFSGLVRRDIKQFTVPDLALPKSISVKRLGDRRSFLRLVDGAYRQKVETAEFSSMDRFTEQASNMILSPPTRDAFDITKEPDKVRDAYGHNAFGQSVLLARRLVEAGSRFVTASGYCGQAWDTHYDNDKMMRETLGPTFDQTLSTLLDDLEQRGLLESTIVLAMGEFGRTPDVNLDGGRDHWSHCYSMVLGGGGIRGGQVVGASDERGGYPADRGVTIGDLYATIYKALGIDWEKEYMHPIGRPVKIANSIDDVTGTPIRELV